LVQLIFSGNIFVAAVYRLQVAVLKLSNFFIKRGADKVCKLKLGVNLVLKKILQFIYNPAYSTYFIHCINNKNNKEYENLFRAHLAAAGKLNTNFAFDS